MTASLLNSIIACPACQAPLTQDDAATSITCGGCGLSFGKEGHFWDLTPKTVAQSSPLWETWQHVQNNGLASYEADPDHNLSVGKRNDCRQFADFCAFSGLVLDVGCGPQAWPAYFDANRDAQFVGVDPLVGTEECQFLKIKALAEFLPFRADTFDHVLFSTTLDHFVDPVQALKEAVRVCKPEGEIDVWLGEKRADTPKPATSPEWYQRLEKPEMAEDLFHIERLDSAKFTTMIAAAGLTVAETVRHQVDEYRVNCFYRLKAGK